MQETAGTEPVKTEEVKPVTGVKKIEISSLSLNQRILLKGGLKDALMNHVAFNLLGDQHKVIFYSTCDMFTKAEKGKNAIDMLDLAGLEYEKSVKGFNGKPERVKFVKFSFDFVIPGTTQKLSVEKEWRAEDFVA